MKSDALTNWAWAQEDLDAYERLILLALVHHAQDIFVQPSSVMLMEMTGLDREIVAGCVGSIAKKGLLRKMETDAGLVTYLTIPKVPKKKAKAAVTRLAPEEDIAAAVSSYNDMALRCGLPTLRKLTDALKASLSARLLNDGGMDAWRQALSAIEVSGHCRGFNDRKWKASFSFMLQAKSYGYLLNGRYGTDYEEKSNGGTRTSPAGRGDERTERLRGLFRGPGGGAAGPRGGRRGGGNDHPDASPPGGSQGRLTGR